MLPKKRPPTHPGEMLLKEFLEPLGMTQKAFAAHLGWTYARLNEVINGFTGQLEQVGVRIRRYSGADLYHWLLPWFSPRGLMNLCWRSHMAYCSVA